MPCRYCAQGRGKRGVKGGGSNAPPQKFTWGSNMVFWPPDLCEKKYFLVHIHLGYRGYIIIILYSETRSRSVFLLSFITHLWTTWKVTLAIFTPSQKIVPARLIAQVFCPYSHATHRHIGTFRIGLWNGSRPTFTVQLSLGLADRTHGAHSQPGSIAVRV